MTPTEAGKLRWVGFEISLVDFMTGPQLQKKILPIRQQNAGVSATA